MYIYDRISVAPGAGGPGPGSGRGQTYLVRGRNRSRGVEAIAELEIRTFKEVDLKGGTVVAAFPSVGMVSTIAATYLITTLKVDQAVAFESDDFPALSMIYASKPKFPARAYALHGAKLAIVICEVPLVPRAHRPVARGVLRWAQANGARQIVTLEGLPADLEGPPGAPKVWGVGSTDRARAALEAHKIPQLESGMIAGVSGVLLNEGRWLGFDVLALLAEARPDQPDATAAVSLTHSLDDLLPELEIDLGPLREQAKALEGHLRRLKAQAQPAVPPETDSGSMYR